MIKVLSYLCDCPKGALRIVLVLALTVTAFGHTLLQPESSFMSVATIADRHSKK